MKRFIVSVLSVAVFFIGLGTLVDKVGAKFRSDEKALGIIAQARQAIGGDQSLAGVKSMTITGRATRTFDVQGAPRSEQGDLEINMQLPDKFSKMVKIGKGEEGGTGLAEKRVDVIVTQGGDAKFKVIAPEDGEGARHEVRVKKVDGTMIESQGGEKKDVMIFRRTDGDKAGVPAGENGEVRTVILNKNGEGHGLQMFHHNELLRTSMALLLTAPEGQDVGYTYAGEESVDGNSCDVINVEATGASFRLYIDRSSHLPRMVTFEGMKPMIFTVTTDEAKAAASAGGKGEPMTFTRRVGTPETAQFSIKFSDYRNVNGVQLPYRWVQTVGGKEDEVIDVTGYEINPANIAEKFTQEKVWIRTKNPEVQK